MGRFVKWLATKRTAAHTKRGTYAYDETELPQTDRTQGERRWLGRIAPRVHHTRGEATHAKAHHLQARLNDREH